MNSALIKFSAIIVMGGFISACSSNPKPAPAQAPLIAAATPPPVEIINTVRGPSLTVDDVLFDFEEASLRPEANGIVVQAADYLLDNPDRNALIEGHTDHTGDTEYNQVLSSRRSDTIRSALIARGISEDRISATGLGESRPVADNETFEGRQANRRVEIIFKQN